MRVLVVDDSADVRFMLRVFLEDADMDVEEAVSGEHALAFLDEDSEIDAIVLDQRMPGMTGLECAREMRERPDCPPIVMFSAYLHPLLAEEAHELGLITVVKTDLDDLVEILREFNGVPA